MVFSRAWGYKHTSIPYGDAAFELMGRKTGAFEAVVTYDETLFERDKLLEFGAVVFNNTNNEIFLPEDFKDLSAIDQAREIQKDARLKKNLLDFIAEGRGLAVIHAGIASLREWPEFGEIMGARFDNHPWSAGSSVTLRVEEPNHPVAQAFGGEYFQITDEIYQFEGNYSRDRIRVLLSIATKHTDMNKGGAIHRTDEDFGMSWVKHYGRGRIFYCALGHQHEIFWNRKVLQHFLAGLQFAIGDLEADATPRNKTHNSVP
ncbi:MAG: ThuA domain-containing protein [Verrucomicrobia bacterium]|nr:ThuA domain-containing protein [Verrucomicrobiota bacterium]